ncbi:MAG TPA: histidine kinase [Acidimicrobiaceae bacterium]|mgnify:CR=1 FL=1|nr:histidine kinase [Acidimicrobiaceae bacterium]
MNVRAILERKGTDVATITGDASLADATARLRDNGVGALVVSPDGATIAGIVSERDVVRAAAAHGASALGRPVESVMSTEVTVCRPADSVPRLMELMTEHRIRHLPVVDDDGRLCGIVSIGDVVKARLGELEVENQALADYLHQGQ